MGFLPAEDRRAHPGAEVLMSGTLVLRHLSAFRTELGEEAVARAIATLPDSLQAEVAALVAGAWLAVAKLDQVYTAMADVSGRRLEDLLPLITERGNEEAFSTIWRALMRMAPGRLVLQRATVVFEKTYSHGVMRARSTEGGAVLELTHWPSVTRNRLLGIAAATRAALRLTGKDGVHVDFETTPDGAVFQVRY